MCLKCGSNFDFYQLKPTSKSVCPVCGSEEGFEQQPTAPAVYFRGEGWTNQSAGDSVDPTSVPGVEKVEKPTLEQKTLYKTRKKFTGKKRKVRI